MQKLFYIFSFFIVVAMFSCILPYPVFSSQTNITDIDATQINNFFESEIVNFSTDDKVTILSLKNNEACSLIDDKFEVLDMLSGYSFYAIKTGGKNHADIETYEKLPFENTWQRRPVLVKVAENSYIPASLVAYQHGYSMLGGSGHFCLHFEGSKTDGTNKIDKEHQKSVKYAKQHAKSFLKNFQ